MNANPLPAINPAAQALAQEGCATCPSKNSADLAVHTACPSSLRMAAHMLAAHPAFKGRGITPDPENPEHRKLLIGFLTQKAQQPPARGATDTSVPAATQPRPA